MFSFNSALGGLVVAEGLLSVEQLAAELTDVGAVSGKMHRLQVHLHLGNVLACMQTDFTLVEAADVVLA